MTTPPEGSAVKATSALPGGRRSRGPRRAARLSVVLAAAGLAAASVHVPTVQASHPSFNPGDVLAGLRHVGRHWYDPDGSLHKVFHSGLEYQHQAGMAFDADGDLYAAEHDGAGGDGPWSRPDPDQLRPGLVAKFDRTGRLLTSFGNDVLDKPRSIVFDAAGNLYVAGWMQADDEDGADDVVKFDAQREYAGRFDPDGASVGPGGVVRGVGNIDLASDQCTLFYTAGTSTVSSIKRFDLCAPGGGGQLADFVPAGSEDYRGLRILPDGRVLVADGDHIHLFNPDGTMAKTYDVSTLECPPPFSSTTTTSTTTSSTTTSSTTTTTLVPLPIRPPNQQLPIDPSQPPSPSPPSAPPSPPSCPNSAPLPGDVNSWGAPHLDPDGTTFWAGAGVPRARVYRFDIETGRVLKQFTMNPEKPHPVDIPGEDPGHDYDDYHVESIAVVDEITTGGAPTVGISDYTLYEGDPPDAFPAAFVVTLNAPLDHDLTVEYSTANGQGPNAAQEEDGDFKGDKQSVIIPKGQVKAVVEVVVIGDTKVEPTETFLVNLTTDDDGVKVNKEQGTGYILNDDGVPQLPEDDPLDDGIDEGDETNRGTPIDTGGGQATTPQAPAQPNPVNPNPNVNPQPQPQVQPQPQLQVQPQAQPQAQVQPQPAPQAQLQQQLQQQMQQQAQTQAQGQLQAQPAMMLERQREIQVETAGNRADPNSQPLLASARRPGPAAAVAGTSVLVAVAVGLAWPTGTGLAQARMVPDGRRRRNSSSRRRRRARLLARLGDGDSG